MAGQNEKIEEFMKNTGTDFNQASDILARNNWKLPESYRDITQICVSAGQRNHHVFNDDVGSQTGSPRHQAIDMGLGAAVHLDKKNVTHPSQINPTSHVPYSTQPGVPSSQLSQHPSLSVRLPLSTTGVSQQERFIPIQMEGGRTVSPTVVHPQASGATLPTSAGSNVPSLDRHSASQNRPYQSPNLPAQARVMLDETVSGPQVPLAAPAMKKEISPDAQHEQDDVFDDKMAKKPPPVSPSPRLKRGFSNIVENEVLVTQARHSVRADIRKDMNDMYIQTFVLPDLTAYNEDFKAFLGKELIETSTLVSLEQAGRLNWWAELRLCQRLLPMATSGDGNCLLHAASLAMWGIHDRQLILRKELHETLTKAAYKDALYRRWRYQQTISNKQSGLVFNESEWRDEWENILRLASSLPRGAPDPARSNNCCDSALTQGNEEPVVYESLEEFHVFVLAHVLKRPIIVVADAILKDSSGGALAPIPFPGIYLPLEVQTCFRSPLLLTYDAAHFSALAPMEQDPRSSLQLPAAIPLVDPELNLLPLHFHIDPGPRVDWNKLQVPQQSREDKMNLLQKFLEVEKLPFKFPDTNGDSDRGSCGSQDSDDTGCLVKEKDKKKEEKKKDARMSQQVQTVAKQFGSIGKSMGKKLKQLGKVGKSDKSRRPSIGNEITQSTRVISSYGHHGNGQDYVLVAKLIEKRGKQQLEMIQNYLSDAKERFEADRELKRRSDVELRSKIALHPAVSPTTVCITPGCELYGTAQTNYLCSKCFALQQRGSGLVQKSGGGMVYNTFPGRARQSAGPSFPSSDEIFVCGKSKFYTSSNEDIGGSSSLNVTNLDKPTSLSNNNVYNPRVRSPSPDYDNVSDFQPHHPTYQQSSPKPLPKRQTEERQHCKTPGCTFYGSQESDGLCSKCYQKKGILQRAMHGTTKL